MKTDKEKAFGLRLKAARERARLSQSEIGRRVGVRPQSVNQWESGQKAPSRVNLIQFARETAAPLQWLLYGGPLSEHEANATLAKLAGKGCIVPMLSVNDAIAGHRPKSDAQQIMAHFPCGPNSYWFDLPDDSNAPVHPKGTVWIVDPDKRPSPTAMVLAVFGKDRRPVYGRLRYETLPAGRVTIIAPLNADWGEARSDHGAIEIIAVMTESVRRGS